MPGMDRYEKNVRPEILPQDDNNAISRGQKK